MTVRCDTAAEGVALVTLDRPGRGNGVVPELSADLTAVLDRLEADRGVRAIVATGAGRQFCAGADLEAMQDHLAEELPRTRECINIGLPPGNGGTWFLPRLVGPGVAAEFTLTGDVIDADRALAIGTVNPVVEPEALLEVSVELAGRIAAKSWRAVEATKQSLRSAWQTDLASSLAANFWTQAALQAGPDGAEGVAAFVEHREPTFGKIP